MWHTYWSSSSSLPNMKAIHWRIKVTYNFEKKVNQKVILGRRPTAAHRPAQRPPARTSLFSRTLVFFLKNPSKNTFMNYRGNALDKFVPTKTTPGQIGPKYCYKDAHISMKSLWLKKKYIYTELHYFTNMSVYNGILAWLIIFKGMFIDKLYFCTWRRITWEFNIYSLHTTCYST